MGEEFYEEDESFLENFINQYSNLKNTGTPCSATEARKWYTKVANESQKDLKIALIYYSTNLNQRIPHSKLQTNDLETIMDDGEYINNCVDVWHNLLNIVHELYENPKKYNYWKGLITIETEEGEVEDEAYYFEIKKSSEDEENLERLYL
jgi:hypothetical protein